MAIVPARREIFQRQCVSAGCGIGILRLRRTSAGWRIAVGWSIAIIYVEIIAEQHTVEHSRESEPDALEVLVC